MTEQIIFRVPDAIAGEAYTFALKAYDDVGLSSGVSNYVQGRFQPQVKPFSLDYTLIILISVSAIILVVTIAVMITSLRGKYSQHQDSQQDKQPLLQP